MEGHGNAITMAFAELGVILIGLALLARLAHRLRFSAVPLYLLAGLAFGQGGLLPIRFTQDFVSIGSEIGIVMLLFTLGLEHTGHELIHALQRNWRNGVLDAVLNAVPGVVAGLLLGFGPLGAALLGGITWVSSSGVVAKLLSDLTSAKEALNGIVAVLVLEDLAMAIYLPTVSALSAGGSPQTAIGAVVVALITVGIAMRLAVRHGRRISRLVGHESDEAALLTILGTVLLVAGIAQRLQVSAAVGALLVGVAVSGSLARRSLRMFTPLRDLFAAIFFLFFGLQIDPGALPPVMPAALALALVTTATKLVVGRVVSPERPWLAGALLTARGEFSIVVAGLGAAAFPKLVPLSAAYVLILAAIGPLLVRFFSRANPKTDNL